ncbi:type II toxin-antitoxin system VapC family toxin [Lusitaniella coriacea LEGE 07157]|uniref:Type II toxin-antitoxin system VapC family toxin n=1 Tax=Lusitaniella coriacea LEGE 07157 TaxID=945747 RepID=A0A8J7IU42_9CYAN|nr:type II toxin-antitoxin system VapC family toxin [Lusitaniella coriacea]MBE9117272.1 type II toxin-antitoxin system VapC family toxin [Lusitaniella coriacea LEGE 07157]
MNDLQKSSVYIETSVISYLTSQNSRDLVLAAHQEITREWWESRRHDYHLVISELVNTEIEAGDQSASQKRKELVQGLDFLKIDEEATRLAKTLIEQRILPHKAFEDALHIAIATRNNVDYLMTWNCKHIANGEIQKRIINLYHSLGYSSPLICTPLELMDRWDYERGN